MEVRVGAWHRALGLIGSAPIVGSGLGTFRFSFMRFSPPGEGWWTEAHDEYVELICDTGLVGGAIFLCGAIAWLALVAHPSRFRGRSPRSDQRAGRKRRRDADPSRGVRIDRHEISERPPDDAAADRERAAAARPVVH